MLEIKDVSKRYGKTLANDRISLTIKENTVSLLVGPNGAGKSTLLKSIVGLVRYQGAITLDGLSTKSPKAKMRMGYVPEIPQPYSLLTVREHMEFIARAYKLTDWQTRSDNLLKRFELTRQADKLGGSLSKGMQQKLSICTALLHQPDFLVFDEPLVGLDPHAIKELKLIFAELAGDHCSLLVSTHILDTVDELWDQVNILMDGKIKASCYKGSLDAQGLSLEDFFFQVTEADSTREDL